MSGKRRGHESFSFGDGNVRSSVLSECIERFSFLIESIRAAHWTLVLFPIRKRLWKLNHGAMKLLLQEIRRNPLLWLLVFVPIALAAEKLNHEAHTLHFVLSVLAILPLAVLLSHATESVAAKTGDSVGGLLNATLGNLTELVIAIAALQAGQYTLVKASVAGAIVTNSLFMLGASLPARRTPVSRSGIQPCRRAISGRLAFSRHNSASDSVRCGRARVVRRSGLTKSLSVALSFLLLLGVRSRSLVFTQHASRIVRGRGRGT